MDQFITQTLEAARRGPRGDDPGAAAANLRESKTTTGRNRNLAERTAVNTVIQGSAADLIKMAMIKVDRRLRGEGLDRRG